MGPRWGYGEIYPGIYTSEKRPSVVIVRSQLFSAALLENGRNRHVGNRYSIFFIGYKRFPLTTVQKSTTQLPLELENILDTELMQRVVVLPVRSSGKFLKIFLFSN